MSRDTTIDRIFNRMKVTALLPDSLVSDVQALSHGKNVTDSLLKALSEWVALKRVVALDSAVKKHPLQFAEGFTAEAVRKLNRR